MKKVFVLLFFISNCHLVTAQIQTGQINIGGGIDTELNTEAGDFLGFKRYYFNAAYQLTDRWAIGSEVHIRRLNTANSPTSYINWSSNATARYYFLNGKRTALYGEGFVGYGRVRANFDPLLSDVRFFNYGLGTGVQFNFTRNIALDTSLRYTRRTSSNPVVDYNALTLRIGVRFSFGNKKK